MECRYVTVPGTPFTLYYAMGERAKTVSNFSIGHQRMDSKSLFSSCRVCACGDFAAPGIADEPLTSWSPATKGRPQNGPCCLGVELRRPQRHS